MSDKPEAAEAAQEPVTCPYCSAYTLAVYFDQNCAGCVKRMTAQFQHMPLSDDEIDRIDKSISATASLEDGKRMFARAIEAAHGIGSKT